MRDKRRPLSLLVALSTFLLCQASQVRDVRPSPPEEQPKTSLPIDILGLQANEDVAVMFGLQLFNDIHTRMAKCRDEKSKIETKFTNQSKRMHVYYNETERVIAKTRAQFERLVQENSEAIEANFEKAFRGLERSRDKKLKRLEARCNNILSSFLEARMTDAVMYANSLMVQDPVAFTRLTFSASTYATQLRGMLPMCIHGNRPHPPPTEGRVDPDSQGGMNFDLCYVTEIRQIINFIDHFLSKADELRQQYYGDDEDFYDAIDDIKEDASGDFPAEYDFEQELVDKPTPSQIPATKIRPTVQTNVPIDVIFEPGPVIFKKPKDGEPDNGDDDDKEKKKPTPTGDTPTEKPPPTDPTSPVVLEPGPVIIVTEKNKIPLPTKKPPSKEPVKPIEDHPPKPDEEEMNDHDSGDKKTTKSPEKEDEEPTMAESKPTHEEPSWLDDAIDKIIGPMADDQIKEKEEPNEPSDLNEKDLRIPARSRSKSESEENNEDGNVDLSFPGVDVEIGPDGVDIEANIGQQGGGPSLNIEGSIIFDDNPEFTTAGSSEDEDNSFITYMLIYFFATLGTLLLLTILVLFITIVVLRMKNSRTPKDMPLLSEEEKIAVMKQSGYVNPTYKFFDSSVKDV